MFARLRRVVGGKPAASTEPAASVSSAGAPPATGVPPTLVIPALAADAGSGGSPSPRSGVTRKRREALLTPRTAARTELAYVALSTEQDVRGIDGDDEEEDEEAGGDAAAATVVDKLDQAAIEATAKKLVALGLTDKAAAALALAVVAAKPWAAAKAARELGELSIGDLRNLPGAAAGEDEAAGGQAGGRGHEAVREAVHRCLLLGVRSHG